MLFCPAKKRFLAFRFALCHIRVMDEKSTAEKHIPLRQVRSLIELLSIQDLKPGSVVLGVETEKLSEPCEFLVKEQYAS